ncbi:MAG TPA: RluA family pseudouridine synthase [Vicinamibacterales bacterium]|jgi:23S rRNA pseudouridine1911/1915/1917 synthase
MRLSRSAAHPSRPSKSRARDLAILYEDEAIVVVDKPAGLLTVPLPRREQAPSVAGLIEERYRSHRARRPFAVHRIDRDTSGIVVFARNPRAQEALKRQFIAHEPERVYLAIVHGSPRPTTGTWRDRMAWDRQALIQKSAAASHPRAMEAVSEYRVVESFQHASLVEVRLRTGKRNQIRYQAALRGHPLVGERQYVDRVPTHPIAFGRQALHAHRLAFHHPVDGRALSFESPLPRDLEELLGSLRRT